MNKDNAKDYLPLVQALAEGKVIQVLSAGEWRDVECLTTLSRHANQYRIKPEPREIWVNRLDGFDSERTFSSRAAAYQYSVPGATQVCYREVIE